MGKTIFFTKNNALISYTKIIFICCAVTLRKCIIDVCAVFPCIVRGIHFTEPGGYSFFSFFRQYFFQAPDSFGSKQTCCG